MPKLTIHQEGAKVEHVLGQNPVVIGRSSSCTIPVRDERASREHCRIEHDQGKWFVVDLNSSNGTLLDGVRITRQELRDGAVIQIGHARVVFSLGAEEAAPVATATLPPLPAGIVLRAVGGPCDGQTFAISKSVTRIGRNRKNDIVLEDGAVSKRHAEIVVDVKGTARIIDQNSRNGVKVNGVRVRERDLDNGDQIAIGKTVLHFVREGAKAAPPPEAPGVPTPAKPKAGLAAVFTMRVKILAAVVGGILVVGLIVKSTETPVRKPELHPDNLLEANPSFEDGQGAAAADWAAAKGRAERDTMQVKDGEYALRLVSLPGAGGDLSALCWSSEVGIKQEIRGKKLELSAWVRPPDNASAALCVAWVAKGVPWLHSFEMGERVEDAADWVRSAETFDPPTWATHVRAGCALVGQGEARFDGLCLRSTGDPVRHRQVSAGRVLFEVDRRGEVVVFIDGKPTFGRGRILAVTTAGRVLSQSVGTIERGSPMVAAGVVRIVGSLGPDGKLPFTEVVSSGEGGIELRYDINPAAEPDCSVALEFLSDESLPRKGVTLETSAGSYTVETAPFEARADVALITLFQGSERVFLALNPAARVSAIEKSAGGLIWRIELPRAGRGHIAPVLTWSATTRERCAVVEDKLNRALKEEEQYGKATRMLREFIASHPLYTQERAKAEQRLRAVAEDIAAALKSVEALASRARVARTDVAFEEAKRACEKLIARLEGDDAAKGVAKTLADLKAEHEIAIRLRRNREAAEILARAKEHVERKEFNIARAECNYILEHFADTMHVGEARSILETLPKPEE